MKKPVGLSLPVRQASLSNLAELLEDYLSNQKLKS